MPTAPIPMTMEVVNKAGQVNRVKQGQCTNCWTPVPKSQVHTHPDPCATHVPGRGMPPSTARKAMTQPPRPVNSSSSSRANDWPARRSGDADEGGATATAPSSTLPPTHRNRQPPPDPERSTW